MNALGHVRNSERHRKQGQHSAPSLSCTFADLIMWDSFHEGSIKLPLKTPRFVDKFFKSPGFPVELPCGTTGSFLVMEGLTNHHGSLTPGRVVGLQRGIKGSREREGCALVGGEELLQSSEARKQHFHDLGTSPSVMGQLHCVMVIQTSLKVRNQAYSKCLCFVRL